MLILSQGLFSFPCSTAWSWEEAHPGQLTRSGQRDIPYHMTSCSVYKLGELARGEITAWGQAGKWVVSSCTMHHSFCIIISPPSFFAALLNCLCLNPWVLLGFLPILLHIPPGVGGWVKQLCGA